MAAVLDKQPSQEVAATALLPFGEHHAFIVGIDNYQQVSPLRTAVNDASKLAEVLRGFQHFFVHEPLLNAQGKAILDLLQCLPERVGKDDRVLFYFAGHGIAADGEDGPAGYLVPADADPNDVKTFIPMELLHGALEALPCRHLLLILDCCFSGAFKWSSQHRAIGTLMPKRIFKERFDRFIAEPAWQVITSAAQDQKALDVLKSTGKPTGDRGARKAQDADGTEHSPFALALFEGLMGAADAKVDQEGDGVITATELYSYIRDQVEPATIKENERQRQTPGFFPLRKHDKGEFIFLHPRHRLNLPPIPNRSPYKGLQAFDEADRDLFYGRERVVREMRARTEACKLIVVSGASGTGKSSVIKAGLLPVLRTAGFRILPVMRPGASPVAALQQTLAQAGLIESAEAVQDETLAQRLSVSRTVLLIDQYEELITRCADAQERARFETLLRKLLDEAAPDALKIVLTVRADFEPQLDDGALKDLWMLGRCTVPPFSVEELKEAIVMPTMQEVLIFDPPELVDAIIEEVVQSPGALPLLSFTLSELYEAYRSSGRQDRALKKEDYDKLGGVMGALRTKADSLYQQLDTKAQNTMRKIMLRMVSLEGELAGKRVALDELIFADSEENRQVQTVVDQLIEARLVVKGKDYIEPAHDALVRAWGTLHGWIHAVGEDKILLNAKLNAAANEYAQLRNVKLLWNANPHLSVLQSELRRPQQWFNEKETVFIRLSERRKKKLSRILRAVTFSVITALSVLTIWAWLEQRRANGTINQARGFTDGLMFQIYDGLRSIAKTEVVRSDLLNKVGTLHSNLSQVGAGEDQSTLFWQSILQGDIQVERHELESARAKFAQAAKIAQGLSQSGNQDWQRNLSISFGKLGDLESGAGNVEAARTWYQRALDLDKRLAAHDADNRIWQRDLLVSYVKLGELEERWQRFDAARTLYQQSGSLAERLAKDARDAQAQHDLFVNQVRRGELEERVGRLEQARAMYEAARRVAERMPKEDPQAARDLLIGLVRLGGLAYKEDRLSAARELYNEVMAKAQRLTEAELGDSAMQDELFTSYKRLAELKAEALELEDARNAADRAWNIAKRQTAINPTDNQWQKYHFMVLIQLGKIEAQGNALAEARNRFNQALELASTEEERQAVLASIAALEGAR